MDGLLGLSQRIHEATGAEGKELELQTLLIAMLYADAMGNEAIGDYFQRRMRDAHEQLYGNQVT